MSKSYQELYLPIISQAENDGLHQLAKILKINAQTMDRLYSGWRFAGRMLFVLMILCVIQSGLHFYHRHVTGAEIERLQQVAMEFCVSKKYYLHGEAEACEAEVFNHGND